MIKTYSHGIKWTDELIRKGIIEVMDFYGISRMPSKSECEAYFGNSSITNKISKTGGFYEWAKKLSLDIKPSETHFGIMCEEKAEKLLIERGYSCEKTSVKFPYDLLIDGCVKIDVKAANITKVRTSDAYSCNLETTKPKSDLLFVLCFDKDKEICKKYIIPSHIMNGKKQLSFGMNSQTYDKYLENWQAIDTLKNAFANLKIS